MNWLPWQDYGKSEDASRHVKALLSAGLTSGNVNLTAKPQKLLAHLLTLFAPNVNDTVISIGDMNGATASVAMKMNRHFIHITGGSAADFEAWSNTASKRIEAVNSGKDTEDVEKDDVMPFEYNVVPGFVDVLNVSRKVLSINRNTGAIAITDTVDENIYDFYAGLIGAYKRDSSEVLYRKLDGSRVIVIDGDEILDTGLLSYLSSKYINEKIIVVAERTELNDSVPTPKNVSVLHAPFDLIRR